MGAEVTKVDMYRTKAQAFSAKVGAEQARIQALGLQSNALLDGYRAAATSVTAKAEMQTKVWETQIHQYEADQNISLNAQKINADMLLIPETN